MKTLVVAAVLLVAGASLAFALPRADVPALLDLTAERMPAPPELRLASPDDGAGVGASVLLSGEATSAARSILDVQYRVDGRRWTSVPDIPRGRPAAPFQVTVELDAGDHVLEARAWDGEAYSLVARALVRRDAPTVRILSPAEGDGVPSGNLTVSGLVVGDAHSVLVEADGRSVAAAVGAGGEWAALIALPAGVHEVRATALADVASLPARVLVAAGDPAPPSLAIVAPRESASYGQMGDLACGGSCIQFTGASRGATAISATLDGRPAGEVALLPGGTWVLRVPTRSLATGPHVATFTPDGGAPRSVHFVARTPLSLDLAGDLDPRPTRTPLSFSAAGEGVEAAEWTLDGAPIASGPSVSLSLGTPGQHVLAVRTHLADGRSASGSVPLYALNRVPAVSLAEPSRVGTDVLLAATADDADGEIVSYRWDLGDGTVLTTRDGTITHHYEARGLHLARVTVLDDFGASAQASALVLVSNVVPLVNFSWEPAEPSVLDVVTFRDESRDLDGRVVVRDWELGDSASSDDEAPAFRFATRGPHAVTLRAIDDSGEAAELTRVVLVRNLAPEPLFSWEPAVPRAHEEVLFRDDSTDADGPVVRREWTLAPGVTPSGPAAVHIFRTPGVHNVTLRVVDDHGLEANVTLGVRVVDTEPTVSAVIAEPPRPRAKEEVRLRVVADDREGAIVALAWEFGDGTGSNETEPLHRYPKRGTYAGRVSVLDDGGLTTVFPFRIEVDNAPPRGTLQLDRGGFAAFPSRLVANASDPDGRVVLYRFDADGDGAPDCETTEPTCEFTYGEPGAHLAQVWLEDDDGAVVTAQRIVDVQAPPSHLAPPAVRIESPVEGGTLRGDFLVRGEAKGVRPIAKVEMQLRADGWAFSGAKEPWRVANGGAVWSALVDTRGFADGEYQLVVRATDEAGGQGIGRARVLVANGARASSIALQVLDAPEEIASDVAIRGSAFHLQGVTNVRWRIDEATWRYVGESPLAFTIPIRPAALAPGEHLLVVEAYRGPDEKAVFEHRFRVPGAAPTLVVDEPPAPVAYGLLRAAGRIVGDGHAEWRLDHDVWRPLQGRGAWNLTHETHAVRGGMHTLDLRAVSPDGRLTSAILTYRVEIVNPPFTASDPMPPRPPPLTLDVPAAPWVALVALGLVGLARRPGRLT